MFVKDFDHLMDLAKEKKAKKIAVVSAEDVDLLGVIKKAEDMGLAEFILIGDSGRIGDMLRDKGWDLRAQIVDAGGHKEAAEKAVDLVLEGQAGTLMKGMLASSVFLRAILNKEKGLNTGRHITQVSVLEKGKEEGLRFITDCAITVDPDLLSKKEVLENAVSLAHKLGNPKPRVAVLASVEVVNPRMQETIDAAALSKMADRGQIKGCIVDGPLAFDNAVCEEAARAKGIAGEVAGKADIVVVPELTVGNALTKSISYIAKKTVVAATVGAAVPIVFTSRTESTEGKLLSIALASYIS